MIIDKMHCAAGIAAAFMGMAISTSYAASPLAAASVSQNISTAYYTGSLDNFGDLSANAVQNLPNGGQKILGTLDVSTQYISNELIVSASGTVNYGIAAVNDSGTAQFSFRVDGPASVQVPIIVSAEATTSVGKDSVVEAQVFLLGSSSYLVAGADSCNGVSVPSSILCAGLKYPAAFSGIYKAGYVLSGSESYIVDKWNIQDYDFVDLAIDSMVSIDPTWALANPGYSLTFSPGLSATVPEPATWAMMLLGLGGIGSALRRRKPTPAPTYTA